MFSLSILAQYAEKTRKEIREIQIRQENIKVYLFADDIILYIKVFKESIVKFLQLINAFDRVAG